MPLFGEQRLNPFALGFVGRDLKQLNVALDIAATDEVVRALGHRLPRSIVQAGARCVSQPPMPGKTHYR
jgi:hypothetical protein